AIDRQGRYLVGMSAVLKTRSSWTLARLKSNGEIDETFGERGLWTAKFLPGDDVEAVFSVALDDKARLVLGGYAYDHNRFRCLAVARVTDSGQSDTSFGKDGTGNVVLTDYGSTVTFRYGPRAAVSKDRIAICGCITGPNDKGTCFGVAVLDETGK